MRAPLADADTLARALASAHACVCARDALCPPRIMLQPPPCRDISVRASSTPHPFLPRVPHPRAPPLGPSSCRSLRLQARLPPSISGSACCVPVHAVLHYSSHPMFAPSSAPDHSWHLHLPLYLCPPSLLFPPCPVSIMCLDPMCLDPMCLDPNPNPNLSLEPPLCDAPFWSSGTGRVSRWLASSPASSARTSRR